MNFTVDGITIFFPYMHIYPEQVRYIKGVIESIKSSGHALIEMPSGTGKTIALLSSTVSYMVYARSHNIPFKVIYCTRTVKEVDKALKELAVLLAYIQENVSFDFLGLGLTQRASMCINETAIASKEIELTCRKMINRLGGLRCDFYENYDFSIPPGVYDFDSLKSLGKTHGVCPYFLVRRSLPLCDCIIFTYKYLIDPRVYAAVSGSLSRDSFVIFDEAHNIDSHCIEALSIDIDRKVLEAATKSLRVLGKSIEVERKARDEPTGVNGNSSSSNATTGISGEPKTAARAENGEYEAENVRDEIIPYFYTDRKTRLLPGDIRNPRHFVGLLRRLIEFFKTRLKTSHTITEQVETFVESIVDLTCINELVLRFCSQRLGQLLQRFSVTGYETESLRRIAEFATMLGLYSTGFSVIFEPYDSIASVFNPVIRLCCLDASIAMSHVFSGYRNVLITSGTLSPIEMYPKLLNFVPAHLDVIGATLHKNLICPLVVTKGNDQMLLQSRDAIGSSENLPIFAAMDAPKRAEISTSFKARADPSVTRNYGGLLIALSKTVPDNIVCFFPSYIYMEEIIAFWSENGIIKEILEHKLLFIETPDPKETDMALRCYRQACDSGRGAILLSVARGKVSEGIDFEDGYGRAVVMMGVPFMYTESIRIRERLAYIKREFGINGYDFLVFDAMRHAAQCLGRVLRKKSDYGLMIMADYRFGMPSKLDKLPQWIKERIEKGHVGLSTDMATSIARYFFKEMAQPTGDVQSCLLDASSVAEYLEKISSVPLTPYG